jgi:hypothetical protein
VPVPARIGATDAGVATEVVAVFANFVDDCVTPERDHRSVTCPDCDGELEPLAADGGTRLRPADDWTCPGCEARGTSITAGC